MPKIPEGRISVYSSEDYIESEKMHKENYKEIHNLTRNILDICQDRTIRAKVIQVLEFTYQKELDCQKNINIELSGTEDEKISE